MNIAELNKLHNDYYATGETYHVEFRLKALKRLQNNIKEMESEILDALKKDLNKSEFEGYETELGIVKTELRETIKHLPRWVRPKHVPTPISNFLSHSYVFPEPYGNILIMSPWNYPFQLAMIPLIGAIASGNCVVLKPSEYSFNTACVIEKLMEKTFDEKHVKVVRGGREANKDLLKEKFDYIFFTGSPTVGQLVMESAAKYLTPITLELGGKSPCIVDETAKIKLAAKRITWGKFLNSGQTCIAPDYLLVQRSVKDELLKYIKEYIVEFYGNEPEKCEYYPKVINEKHYNRLKNLFNDGDIILGGNCNDETRQISPTLIENMSLDSTLMQDEIFGPILPVITFDTVDDVLNIITNRPKPLAFYLFTRNQDTVHRFMKNCSFGGGCINDTIMHIANSNLPFGGVGNSGMGQYHDKLTFDTFSHYKPVLRKSNLIDIPLRYPPFKDHINLLRKILR